MLGVTFRARPAWACRLFSTFLHLTDRGKGRNATGTWSGEYWVRPRKQVLGGLQHLGCRMFTGQQTRLPGTHLSFAVPATEIQPTPPAHLVGARKLKPLLSPKRPPFPRKNAEDATEPETSGAEAPKLR